MRHRNIFFLIVFILVAVTSSLISANDHLDYLYEENLSYKQDLYSSIHAFMERNPNYGRLDDLYFKLAELSAEIHVTEPAITLGYFRKILEINPNYPMNDVVLYNLAYYSADVSKKQISGRRHDYIQDMIDKNQVEPIIRWDEEFRLTEEYLKESISAYREILREFPESEYYSESLYRLAVLYYEIGMDANEPVVHYQKAQDLLNFLVHREGDEYQHLGLYQRAWTNFSINRFREAINDFATILNLSEADEMLQAYFEQDAIENMAFSLERMDNADYLSPSQSALFAKENIPQLLDSDEHLKQIIGKVIKLKFELNAPFHAIEYYDALMSLFPLNPENPLMVDNIAKVYQRYAYMLTDEEDLNTLVIAQKVKLVEQFNYHSDWYQYNINRDIKEQLEIIRAAYEFLEPRYFNRFVYEKSDENFRSYYNLVSDYGEFPQFSDERGQKWKREKDKQIVEGILEIAQLREEPHYYLMAYEIIDDFNNTYPEHDDYIDYNVRKFLAIEILFGQLYHEIEQEPYVDEKHEIVITQQGLRELFIESANDFIELTTIPVVLNEYIDDIVRALYERSQLYMAEDFLSEAEKDLKDILSFDIQDALRRAVLIYLAQINETLENYALAENYYREAIDYSLNEQDRENIKNHYRVQMRVAANKFFEESSYNKAAQEYLRLADEYRNYDIDRFVGFTREAIDIYLIAQNYQRAQELLIDLSNYRSQPEEAYILYASAWNIADTLMSDPVLKNNLRKEYIEKYPRANASYITRYEIIDETARKPDTKYQAANMLLELHEEATAGQIDYGQDRPEDIYFDALELYHDYDDQEFLISLILEFTDLYPQDHRTDDLLELAATKYADMGMDEELEDLARYIYSRNPESGLYENIARKQLLDIYNDVTSYFMEEEFQKMFDGIKEFEELDRKLKEDNLALPLEDFYLDFEDYNYSANRTLEFRALVANLEDTLNQIEMHFINTGPEELIKIDKRTEWQQDLAGGDNRLEKFVERANNYRDTIMGFLRQSQEYEQDIEVELNTKALYIIAKIYDHAADVIDTQLEEFIMVSTQLQEVKEYDENEYLSIVGFINSNYKEPYIEFLESESAGWYDLIIKNFVYNLNHSDHYTEAAGNRLSDWGLMTEQISLYSDNNWLGTVAQTADIPEMSAWTNVLVASDVPDLKEVPGLIHTEAKPIWLEIFQNETLVSDSLEIGSDRTENKTLFLRRFDLEGEVLEATLSYASYHSCSIWINGQSVLTETDINQNETNDSFYVQGVTVSPDNFAKGENEVMIRTDSTGDPKGLIFNMKLIVTKE